MTVLVRCFSIASGLLLMGVFVPVCWSLFSIPSFIVASAIFGLLWLISRQQCERKVFLVVFPLFVVLQFWAAYFLRVEYRTWDVYTVVSSAMKFVTGVPVYWQYFATYPNNLALAYLLGGYLKLLSLVGVPPSIFVVMVLNIVAIDVSIALLMLIAKSVGGERTGWVCGLMACLYMPFVLYVPICYSDTLCMPFAIGGFLLAMKLIDLLSGQTELRSWWQQAIGSATMLFVAFRLKGSCIVVLVALLLYAVLKLPWHRFWKMALPCTLSFVVLSGLFWGGTFATCIRRRHFDRFELPVAHWLAMGLHGKGNFCADDVHRLQALPNVRERKRVAWDFVRSRVQALGVSGLVFHCWKKSTEYCWNSGTCMAERYLGDYGDKPVLRNVVHDWVLSKGKHHGIVQTATSGIYLLLIVFALVGAVRKIYASNCDWLFCLRCLWAGGVAFFMIWETHPRYSLHLMPFVILLAALALSCVVTARSES